MKKTFRASADIALIKYWGKKDENLRLPENNSISMILNGLDTITTVEFQEKLSNDSISINGTSKAKEARRIVQHLNRIRALAHTSMYARVESVNTFPKGTGLSSSGSGFAALTYAATSALGLELSERELSILARQASGTACRCVCDGFVEWDSGTSSENSYSKTIFPSAHWYLHDVVAIIDEKMKRVSSTEGHKSAKTSPFYEARQQNLKQKLLNIKKALLSRNFSRLGTIVEAEALEFHSILLTSAPPLVAWHPGTLEIIHEVRQMRQDGLECYFTINTGFNVHILTEPSQSEKVQSRISALPSVTKTILATTGHKPEEAESLF